MSTRRVSPLVGLLILVSLGVDAQNGAELYARTCPACHGADGIGVMPGVPDLTVADGTLNLSGRFASRACGFVLANAAATKRAE